MKLVKPFTQGVYDRGSHNKMLNSAEQKHEIRLYYKASEYFVLAGFLIFASIITGYLVLMQQPELMKRLFMLCSAITGMLMLWSLRAGLKLKREAAWYISFQPGFLRINFFNYSSKDTSLDRSDAILEVPDDQLIWIRQTLKIGAGDDSDAFYVDMRVTHSTWAAAKNLQTTHWSQSDPMQVRGPGAGVEFFYDDIIRVRLATKWPKELVQHWHCWKYPVSADYEIKHGPRPRIDMFSPG
jgi:hypothetical protein